MNNYDAHMRSILAKLAVIGFLPIFFTICLLTSIFSLSTKTWIQTMYHFPFMQNTIPVSSQEISRINDIILPYITERNSSIDSSILETIVLTESDGTKSPISKAEVMHLVDVRKLYQNLTQIYISSVGMLLVIWMILISEEKIEAVVHKARLLLKKSVYILALCVPLGYLAWPNLFTLFHVISFPQGNWSFPYNSVLIRLYPNVFWQSYAVSILLVSYFLSGILLCISTQYCKSRQNTKNDA